MNIDELKTGQYFKLKDINTLANEHLHRYFNKFYKDKDNYLFTAIKCNIKDEFSMDETWYLVDTVQFPRLREQAFENSEILLAYVNDKQFAAYHNIWKFGNPFIVNIDEDILDHLDLRFDLRDYDIIEKEDTYSYAKDDLIEDAVICSFGKDAPRCFVKKNANKDKKAMISKEVSDILNLFSYPQVNHEALFHLWRLKELASGEYDSIYDEVNSLFELINDSRQEIENLVSSYHSVIFKQDMKFDINWDKAEKNQDDK